MSTLSSNSPFYCAHCLQCRLPTSHCVCAQIKQCDAPFSIMICSHRNEWHKIHNTGHWAFLSSPAIKRIQWHRKTELIDWGRANNPLAVFDKTDSEKNNFNKTDYLLFPSAEAQDIQQLQTSIERLWVIDGTWQEAQKMLRQSPWLQNLPQVKIAAVADSQSAFVLRRNQQGLSTLEAISAAIAKNSDAGARCAEALDANFELFQNALLHLKR